MIHHSKFCNSPTAYDFKFGFTTSKHSCLEIRETVSINFSTTLYAREERRSQLSFNSIKQKVLKLFSKLESGQLEMSRRKDLEMTAE